MKKLIGLLLCAALLCAAASAESYIGTIVAAETVTVEAQATGTLLSFDLNVGDEVTADTVVGTISETKVFSSADGRVVSLEGEAGEDVSGTVAEIQPENLYHIYCTVDGAYESPETEWVRNGETLYVKCTNDGTHRAVGIVSGISGETYELWVTGGELYIGEVVKLYRDAEFSKKLCVGKGTVLASDVLASVGNGQLTNVAVTEGELVERGELLFTTVIGDDTSVRCDVDGIVTAVYDGAGDYVLNGTIVAEVAPTDALLVEVMVPETAVADLKAGDSVEVLPYSEDNVSHQGVIRTIGSVAQDEGYAVRIAVSDLPKYIGLHCEVILDE
ncbi:MAG: HlyD family efflux transporter periplasmic adaptor subunit [Clostridia bacterium]|nr:HlyD family efflux transporter periplasmic adaptor subunit [Clostridia bacterium]